MRILVATDAWHPQVNGVVRTLTMMAEAAKAFGVDVSFLNPQSFRTFAMPSYRDLRVALPYPAKIAQLIAEARPDSIHIATEGPIGLLARRHCRQQGLPFTTSFHTRFPEYISARLPIPESWIWAALRAFHGPSQAVMAATPALASGLRARGFRNVVLWPRGVDRDRASRPDALSTGRSAERRVARSMPRCSAHLAASRRRVCRKTRLEGFGERFRRQHNRYPPRRSGKRCDRIHRGTPALRRL